MARAPRNDDAEAVAFYVSSLIARPTPDASASPFLNKRTEALLGREFTLEKPIIDGNGTVRIGDTVWRVAGPDTPAGTRVKVVQVDGANLTVAAA